MFKRVFEATKIDRKSKENVIRLHDMSILLLYKGHKW